MSRDEVIALVQKWVKEGLIMSNLSSGLSHPEINRRVANKELFRTSCATILAIDRETRDMFEELVDEGRIMDTNMCAVKKELLTTYAITKACQNGELARVDLGGKQSLLFID